MNYLLVCDAYPPQKTSAAVHMHELAHAIASDGHRVTVLTPGADDLTSSDHNVYVCKIKTRPIKDTNYLLRTLHELIMPLAMLRKLKNYPDITNTKYDGIIWYSPSIFWGPLIARLKKKFNCNAYLILRDIFPQWALDLGLMRKAPPYFFFKLIERYQYQQASCIGYQSPGNLPYLTKIAANTKKELLWNWVNGAPSTQCSIDLSKSPLHGRKILVYTGNLGVAQDIDLLIQLITAVKNDSRIGFVFVGRGSYFSRLKAVVQQHDLDNVLIYSEIPPEELGALYQQCALGIVSLHKKHTSHNIPGKFLSYIAYGLPVLASVNAGNDLVKMIEEHQVGMVSTANCPSELAATMYALLKQAEANPSIHANCMQLAKETFSLQDAKNKILAALR